MSKNNVIYSIAEFCEAHGISRSLFYILLKKNLTPKLMKVGKRTLISQEAAAEWRREMENPNNQSQKI